MKKCRTYYFPDDGSIPNNQKLPLLVYSKVLSNTHNATKTKQLLSKHGWSGAWVNGIFSYHHYHSTAHEVLVVTSGSARVQFGGKQGEVLNVEAGDVIVIPAGVGHCNLGNSADFRVVGAYPERQQWDLCTGKPEERPQVLENIRSVPLPETDPITGEEEPLLIHWNDGR